MTNSPNGLFCLEFVYSLFEALYSSASIPEQSDARLCKEVLSFVCLKAVLLTHFNL